MGCSYEIYVKCSFIKMAEVCLQVLHEFCAFSTKFFNNEVAARGDPPRSNRILSSFSESIPISDFQVTTHPQCRLGKEKTNMAYRDEIDDAFDAVVFLEERYFFTFTMPFNRNRDEKYLLCFRCFESGYEEGYKDGKLKGLQEGRELGLIKGCEVGSEVSYY